jgi:hypothetical protein
MIDAIRQTNNRRDQYGTDIVAQIRVLQCPMSDRRTGPLLTSGKCRARADEKFAQAEREPQNQKRLLAAARGWLFLAGQMGRLEAGSSRCKKRTKERADYRVKKTM